MRMLIALVVLMSTVALGQTRPAGTGQRTTPTAPAPAAAPVVSEVLATQVMLDRAGFSPGEIDGLAGANLKRALTAFQKAQGLTPTGQPDDATWQRLTQLVGEEPPLLTYEITGSDVEGPFTAAIPDDLVAQSKLPALGYVSALEKISERFHASPRLLQALNKGATFSAAGERVTVPNVEPLELPAKEDTTARNAGADGVTIAVSKSTNALTVEDAAGRVLFHAPVTSGSERDPLPIGTWKITGVHIMPKFNYNPDLFWDADPTHTKATLAAGPNNPVGIAWIDLSKEHYGIHGTPEPSRVGHTQSHGCVRLTNWDVRRLLQWITPGTAVVFRE